MFAKYNFNHFATGSLNNEYYSLFTFSWPRFESGSLRNGGMLAFRIFAESMMSRNSIAQLLNCSTCFAAFLPREEAAFYPLKLAVLSMLGRRKRANTTAKSIIYNVYQYFQKETAKSKHRGALKWTSRTAEATGYSERTCGEL